jgi:hypothetical protein
MGIPGYRMLIRAVAKTKYNFFIKIQKINLEVAPKPLNKQSTSTTI